MEIHSGPRWERAVNPCLLCHAWNSPTIRPSDVAANNDNALSLTLPESHWAIFVEISQWRWCYVTVAVDPAVHITNASHCGRVTCLIQATFRHKQQQQQCSSCYYSLAAAAQDYTEPCSAHTATSSPEQPCSAPQHSSFYNTWGSCSCIQLISQEMYKLHIHSFLDLISSVFITVEAQSHLVEPSQTKLCYELTQQTFKLDKSAWVNNKTNG